MFPHSSNKLLHAKGHSQLPSKGLLPNQLPPPGGGHFSLTSFQPHLVLTLLAQVDRVPFFCHGGRKLVELETFFIFICCRTRQRGSLTALGMKLIVVVVVVVVLTHLEHMRVCPYSCTAAPNYRSHVPADMPPTL